MASPLPKVSIITVVLNARKNFLRTLESVRAQTYPNVEYVVVDAVSKDGTLEEIQRAAAEGVVHRWVSEKDKGIYDAMNKGQHLATGDYVCFLNAGDELYEPTTLEKIFGPEGDKYDVYYGDTVLTDADFKVLGPRSHKKLPEKLTWKSFRWGSVVCHQAFFARRSLSPEYDLTYPRSGDIEWSIRVMKQAKSARNVGFVTTKYLVGGFSHQNRWSSMKERFWLGARHFGFLPAVWDNGVMLTRHLLRRGGA